MIIENYLATYITYVRDKVNLLPVNLLPKTLFSPSLDNKMTIDKLLSSDNLDTTQMDIKDKFTLLLYSRETPRRSESIRNTRKPMLISSTGTEISDRLYAQAQFNMTLRFLTNDVEYSSLLMQLFLCELQDINALSSHMMISSDETYPVTMNITHNDLNIEDHIEEPNENSSLHMVSWDITIDAPLVSPSSSIYPQIEKLKIDLYNYNEAREVLYKSYEITV